MIHQFQDRLFRHILIEFRLYPPYNVKKPAKTITIRTTILFIDTREVLQ